MIHHGVQSQQNYPALESTRIHSPWVNGSCTHQASALPRWLVKHYLNPSETPFPSVNSLPSCVGVPAVWVSQHGFVALIQNEKGKEKVKSLGMENRS